MISDCLINCLQFLLIPSHALDLISYVRLFFRDANGYGRSGGHNYPKPWMILLSSALENFHFAFSRAIKF